MLTESGEGIESVCVCVACNVNHGDEIPFRDILCHTPEGQFGGRAQEDDQEGQNSE